MSEEEKVKSIYQKALEVTLSTFDTPNPEKVIERFKDVLKALSFF